MPAQHETPTLAVERHDEVAVVRLSRADRRNALDDVTVDGLGRYFSRVPDGVRAVVLCGDGEHFSAGLDLATVPDAGDLERGISHSRMWHRAFQEIESGRVPVISVLHGAVIGGGLELAAATHIRVAERSAFYALPEAQRGIFLGGGGSVRITGLLGLPCVQDMMLTGRVLTAEEGHRAGVSQYLVDEGEGLARAIELARRAAANPPMSNFAILQALPRIARSDPAAGLFTESLMAAIAESTPEAEERLREFLDKRSATLKPE